MDTRQKIYRIRAHGFFLCVTQDKRCRNVVSDSFIHPHREKRLAEWEGKIRDQHRWRPRERFFQLKVNTRHRARFKRWCNVFSFGWLLSSLCVRTIQPSSVAQSHSSQTQVKMCKSGRTTWEMARLSDSATVSPRSSKRFSQSGSAHKQMV